MPEYPFRTPTGEIVHRAYRMSEAPSIGDTIEINGQTCRRIASDCLVNGDPPTKRYPVESIQIQPLPGDKVSAKGRLIIKNEAHHKELCRIHRLTLDT